MPSLDHVRDTKAMCVRCCVLKNLTHVLRMPAPGVPRACYIHLCSPCLDVYRGLGLV